MTLDRLYQIRSVIFERQEEDRDLHVALAERQTRALMSMVARSNGWQAGAEEAAEWELVPRPDSAVDRLPSVDQVMGMFGGPGGGGMEFAPDEVPGLADFFEVLDEKGADWFRAAREADDS